MVVRDVQPNTSLLSAVYVIQSHAGPAGRRPVLAGPSGDNDDSDDDDDDDGSAVE